MCQKSKILVIGVGLIGGSLAAALTKNGGYEVSAFDRHKQSLVTAKNLGLIHKYYDNLDAAIDFADIIVLAVPVLSLGKLLEQIATCPTEGKIITDTGSVKGCLITEAQRVFGCIPSNLVLAHPIAGSEQNGVLAADPSLYVNRKVILTPSKNTDKQALSKVKALWQKAGAQVMQMEVERHDKILALTSHLPHLLAFSLVNTLDQSKESQDIFRYAAGGLRDFTRIAASDPVVWHDIFMANRPALLTALDQFLEDLNELRGAVVDKKSDEMLQIFEQARFVQENFANMLKQDNRKSCQENPEPSQMVSYPVKNIQGDICVPGDKSISHRAIMLGAIAEGRTEVTNFLAGEDALATLQAFRDMGVNIQGPNRGRVVIDGVGMHGLKAPEANALDLGNSGTAVRLLAGLLAGQGFSSTLIGDSSLTKRPMKRVLDPLRQMGAKIEANEGKLPMRVYPSDLLKGIDYKLPMASAQVKSCVLLAGLYSQGITSVTEPAPTRDHTERMLRAFSYEVKVQANRISLEGGGKLKATSVNVPADISSAAFFMVAASIVKESKLILRNVGMNPTRTGVLDILRLMGANIEVFNQRQLCAEPVADLCICSASLKGIDIPEHLVPLAIDEFPVLFVAAACASGQTRLTGASELRVKEADRIQVMAEGLQILGINAQPTEDGMVVEGGNLKGGIVDSAGDHRIAMAFAVAALRAEQGVRIKDCDNIATSFPGFGDLATSVGFNIVGNYQ